AVGIYVGQLIENNMKRIIIMCVLAVAVASCAVVRQGEIGVKRKLGKLSEKTYDAGAVGFNPFTTTIIKLPLQTVNVQIAADLPSKEGLNVGAVISILYRVKPEDAINIIENVGTNYENVLITSVFRSAAADVCSRFFAKDMHTAQRAVIEREIAERMSSLLADRGFDIEAVLLKSIELPAGLARAVEEKLEAEQDAQRMQFLLERERLEAQRKLVEAEGTRDAQKVLSEGLSDQILRYQAIEAFRELSNSPNSKVIITDSQTPMIIQESGDN
ncbi:MAG: prohibitin family protein, partial [Bacteroidota bacterium]